jgi:hypothetical protein
MQRLGASRSQPIGYSNVTSDDAVKRVGVEAHYSRKLGSPGRAGVPLSANSPGEPIKRRKPSVGDFRIGQLFSRCSCTAT